MRSSSVFGAIVAGIAKYSEMLCNFAGIKRDENWISGTLVHTLVID